LPSGSRQQQKARCVVRVEETFLREGGAIMTRVWGHHDWGRGGGVS
jgi:hypothetical protein